MIDSALYRARIGLFNVKKIKMNKEKSRLIPGSFLGVYCWLILVLIATNIGLSLILLFNSGTNFEYLHSNYKLHGYPMAGQYTDVGFKLSVTLFTLVTWNTYMRAINGNSKNCINVAH